VVICGPLRLLDATKTMLHYGCIAANILFYVIIIMKQTKMFEFLLLKTHIKDYHNTKICKVKKVKLSQ
jgi:hypothetical protein